MTDAARHSIESANTPLAYRATGDFGLAVPEQSNGSLGFRVAARALAGMQKEALVAQSGDSTVWRLVCDEGPYLDGTDLAPPPLAYFSAGMASSIAASILVVAKASSADLRNLRVVLDNHYSMEGSAIRGTMVAGALPVGLSVNGQLADGGSGLDRLVFEALASSPVDSLMRNELTNFFSILHNGHSIPTGTVAALTGEAPEYPADLFTGFEYKEQNQQIRDAVTKLESTESVFDANHGTGAAMKDTQKRQLHIRSVLTVRPDAIREIKVQIFKPIGSVFRFLSDDSPSRGGLGRAPSGLSYLSAGIGFCFMTQLGRYAGITKKDLSDYGVIQDTRFDLDQGRALPIDTYAYISTSEDEDMSRKYVDMGEQTCFLHGAYRMANKTRIKVSQSMENG